MVLVNRPATGPDAAILLQPSLQGTALITFKDQRTGFIQVKTTDLLQRLHKAGLLLVQRRRAGSPGGRQLAQLQSAAINLIGTDIIVATGPTRHATVVAEVERHS